MAISKKGRRKITINEKVYFWKGYDEYNQSLFDGKQISIVSENQQLFIKYGLFQEDKNRFLFIDQTSGNGGVMLFCPQFENIDNFISPGGVSRLIQWIEKGFNTNDLLFVKDSWSKGKRSLSISEVKLIVEEIRSLLK